MNRRHLGRSGSGTTIAWNLFAVPQRAIIFGAFRDLDRLTRTSKP
jgi:hypothetical protein